MPHRRVSILDGDVRVPRGHSVDSGPQGGDGARLLAAEPGDHVTAGVPGRLRTGVELPAE
ncbi:hypothetical protein D3C87_2169750 [compost metagenome]